MRTLDSEEKLILTQIVESHQKGEMTWLANLVDKYLVNKDIRILFHYKRAFVHFDEQIFLADPNLVEIARETSWVLMKFVNLLKYFQDQGYLYLWEETQNQHEHEGRYGRLIEGHSSIVQEINDKHIADLLVTYSFRTIVVGQTLIDYVANGYKTTDELQSEANLKIARDSLDEAKQSVKLSSESLQEAKKSVSKATVAIWVSVLLTVVSLASSFYLGYQQSNGETKVNSKQFDNLTTKLDSMKGSISTLNEHIDIFELPDTLKTIITKPVRVVKE